MIVWLASYPKSGNTLLRSILTSYFFSHNGDFNFELLNKIGQFPNIEIFNKLGINTLDENLVFKNLIKAQEIINKEYKNYKFIKTHSAFCKVNGYNFTNLENTLGVIYIVRDPRNIVTSFAHHYDLNINEATNALIDKSRFLVKTSSSPKVILGSWNFNFNSWKIFERDKKYLLIKYEDLIYDKKNTILKVFEFIGKLLNQNIAVDDNKLKKCIVSTDFKKMKSLEIKETFYEAPLDTKNGGRKPFFKLGPNNDYKKLLDKKNRDKIEKHFKLEMSELGYI